MSLPLLGAGPSAPGPPPVDYLTPWGVAEHFKMDGGSGASETGWVAGLVIASTNTVGTAAGVIGTSRQFNSASSRKLSKTDDATLSTGNIDFWMSCWVYLDSKSAEQVFISKGAVSTTEYGLEYISALDRFNFFIRGSGGGTYREANANTFGAASVATWYFLMGYHDSVGDLVGISVNGGAWNTLATSGTAPGDAGGQFAVGSDSGSTLYTDGRIDEVTFGKNPPTGIAAMRDQIRDRLYNSGAGRAFPFS